MIERILSGHDRIDALLGGGLPANGINLFIGHPGTGKTILAEQYLFRNASVEHPGVYLSTVSEPFDKILRYGESMSFFDVDAIGSSVFYDDLGEVVNEDGLTGVVARIDEILKEQRPGYVVIDSFKALRSYASDDAQFRRFLHDLAGRLTAAAVSSFWIGEYDRDQAADAPEFAVADSIIALHANRAAERELRVLQVLKLRGSGFRTGQHAYRIGTGGLDVFPRLADEIDNERYDLGDVRVSTGIPALDAGLGDGYWPGSVTVIAGPTGAGKTLMGLHFLFHGADHGEPGVLATFQEHSTQLNRIARGFGWDLDRSDVHVLGRSPVDLYVDEWVYDLLACVEETGARRVVIDSLGDLLFASPDSTRFREMMYSLAQRLARRGISLMMTHETAELFRVTRLSEIGMSHLADNVVVLQYLRAESEVKRALLVLKTRASEHHPEIREFKIQPEGIVLGEKFAANQGFE
ncbi:MAG: circadian clock protein KaiC [Actinomycetota bacterium]|nr:circadian clock protein KaiC [Actinomycetota bacterium]